VDAALQKIPLVDLRAQYLSHRDEFDRAVADCLLTSSFINGRDHSAFAEEFADWCGGGFVVLCGNGTDALTLALIELLGRGNGTGEIITVAHTFIATAEAISNAGYRPVFVDIEPATYVMDPTSVKQAISPLTRALVPVHLYGQMAPMEQLMEIAATHGLKVVEDAAQAHGATWRGKPAGHWGNAACFSFYPGKNLGAWGDGGAVFTRNQALAARIAMRANHGRKDKYLHEFEGLNSRLDGLQAAILRVKLRYLDSWTAARRRIAGWYNKRLAGLAGVQRPEVHPYAGHVFHLYVIEVDERDRILTELKKQGIDAGVHYPIPLHRQPAYAHLGYSVNALPVSSRAASRVLSLPLYPELTEAQVNRVVEALAASLTG